MRVGHGVARLEPVRRPGVADGGASGASASGADPTFFRSLRYASFDSTTSVAVTRSPGTMPSSIFVSFTRYGIVIAGMSPGMSPCLMLAWVRSVAMPMICPLSS